jgi:nucleoside-diphosphate-sugar epimerase
MTVLVAGGEDFLGLHIVREHLLAGRHVTVLARPPAAAVRERVERFLAADGTTGRLPTRTVDLLAVVEIDPTHHALGLSPVRQRALAARARGLWHVATPSVPGGQDGDVWRTTVSGTENVLRFAALLHPSVPLRHVSTAFVCGRTPVATVREHHSAEVTEFENACERAAHLAEGLVRRWANRHARGALVLRPGALVPDPAAARSLPAHPLRTLCESVAGALAAAPAGTARPVLRVPGEPRAFLTLLQAGWAARAMLRLGDRVTGPGTRTVHVVHPVETPLRTVVQAMEDVLPVRLRITPDEPADPTRAEVAFRRRAGRLLPYLRHRRRFDGSALRAHGVELAPPPVLDRARLRAVLAEEPAGGARWRAAA